MYFSEHYQNRQSLKEAYRRGYEAGRRKIILERFYLDLSEAMADGYLTDAEQRLINNIYSKNSNLTFSQLAKLVLSKLGIDINSSILDKIIDYFIQIYSKLNSSINNNYVLTEYYEGYLNKINIIDKAKNYVKKFSKTIINKFIKQVPNIGKIVAILAVIWTLSSAGVASANPVTNPPPQSAYSVDTRQNVNVNNIDFQLGHVVDVNVNGKIYRVNDAYLNTSTGEIVIVSGNNYYYTKVDTSQLQAMEGTTKEQTNVLKIKQYQKVIKNAAAKILNSLLSQR